PPDRQPLAVAEPPEAADLLQPLDVDRHLPAQRALDRVVLVDVVLQARELLPGEVLRADLGVDRERLADALRQRDPDAIDVGEGVRDLLVPRDVDAEDAGHAPFSFTPVAASRPSGLPLLVPRLAADDVHHAAAAHDLALLADASDRCSYLHGSLPTRGT